MTNGAQSDATVYDGNFHVIICGDATKRTLAGRARHFIFQARRDGRARREGGDDGEFASSHRRRISYRYARVNREAGKKKL